MRTPLSLLSVRVILAFVVLSLSCAPGAQAQQPPLYMGLVSADSRQVTLERWGPVLADLSQAIGRKVEPLTVEDYAGIIWHLKSGKAQLAWVGNKSAIEAVDRANCQVLLMTLSTKSGSGYYSHLIVHRDSPLEDVDDVLERSHELTFGNGDPNSTSGFVVPGYYVFAKRGLAPKRIFKRVINQNHEANFKGVAAGRVDVATNNNLALARHGQRSPHKARQVKVIWTSPRIPNDPIVVRRDMAPVLKQRIAEFFVEYGRPAQGKSEQQVEREQALLRERNWAGYTLSDNSQLIPIRKLELFKARLKIESDPAVTGTARAQRLNDIDRELEALDQQD